MKKTITILILGFALISIDLHAQDRDSMYGGFDGFEDIQDQAVDTADVDAVPAEGKGNHSLMVEDNDFLSDIEDIQKHITFMQLELAEKELEYKVLEQAKKLKELENPTKVEETSSTSTSSSSLDKMIPSSSSSLPVDGFDDVVSDLAPVKPEAAPLTIKSIKGMKADLTATLYSEDIGTSIVKKGDILNNGFKVKEISQRTVTLENADGDIETVGITF